MENVSSAQYEQFLALYSVNQKRIFAFILSLVPRRADAEDVLQQTAMDMWKLFDRYERGTDFAAWGLTIARFRVLKYRKSRQKEKFISFLNEEAFQLILNNLSACKDSNLQLPALEGCVARLNEHEKLLLADRYENGQTYRDIADKLNCSLQLVYKKMTVIHTNLLRCIRHTIAVWDA